MVDENMRKNIAEIPASLSAFVILFLFAVSVLLALMFFSHGFNRDQAMWAAFLAAGIFFLSSNLTDIASTVWVETIRRQIALQTTATFYSKTIFQIFRASVFVGATFLTFGFIDISSIFQLVFAVFTVVFFGLSHTMLWLLISEKT